MDVCGHIHPCATKPTLTCAACQRPLCAMHTGAYDWCSECQRAWMRAPRSDHRAIALTLAMVLGILAGWSLAFFSGYGDTDSAFSLFNSVLVVPGLVAAGTILIVGRLMRKRFGVERLAARLPVATLRH